MQLIFESDFQIDIFFWVLDIVCLQTCSADLERRMYWTEVCQTITDYYIFIWWWKWINHINEMIKKLSELSSIMKLFHEVWRVWTARSVTGSVCELQKANQNLEVKYFSEMENSNPTLTLSVQDDEGSAPDQYILDSLSPKMTFTMSSSPLNTWPWTIIPGVPSSYR